MLSRVLPELIYRFRLLLRSRAMWHVFFKWIYKCLQKNSHVPQYFNACENVNYTSQLYYDSLMSHLYNFHLDYDDTSKYFITWRQIISVCGC